MSSVVRKMAQAVLAVARDPAAATLLVIAGLVQNAVLSGGEKRPANAGAHEETVPPKRRVDVQDGRLGRAQLPTSGQTATRRKRTSYSKPQIRGEGRTIREKSMTAHSIP